MWSSRLFWKVFLVYAGLNLTLAIGFLLITLSWQREQLVEQVRVRLHDVATLLRSQVQPQLPAVSGDARQLELQQRLLQLKEQTGLRMTIVAADGVVLADTDEDPRELKNHLERPELQDAQGAAGIGTARRQSPSLGLSMYYLALPVQQEGKLVGFVRVAAETGQIEAEINAVERLFWWLAVGIGLAALLLTYLVVGRIIRPITQLTTAAEAISAGDYSRQAAAPRGDEVGTLADAFQQMQLRLADQVGQLQVGSQRLETVLGSMVEGVIVVDPQERLLLANDASRKLLGFVVRDAVGRPLAEATRSLVLHDAVAQAFSEEEPVAAEFEVPGVTRHVLALRAVRLPGKPCPGVVIVLHDVTELRRLENLRREFVANVSHELKTPLAAIKAYAETLRLGGIHDQQNNLLFVARIEEQAERLHQLILDLISLAQVESGREVFDIGEVPLADLVAECIDQHQEGAHSKNISLHAAPSDQSIQVLADEEGIRTILNNLIDNALKYTPSGGEVRISWRAESTEAVLEVCDTGIGIAARDQQRVFERFYRADKARSRELGGTGLGLSIVKHLAQAFGGSVGLESKLGEGSTFHIRLPLAGSGQNGG